METRVSTLSIAASSSESVACCCCSLSGSFSEPESCGDDVWLFDSSSFLTLFILLSAKIFLINALLSCDLKVSGNKNMIIISNTKANMTKNHWVDLQFHLVKSKEPTIGLTRGAINGPR